MIDTLSELSVLLVEDEEITRIIIENILKEKCGKLFVASNGKDGLEAFIEKRPDIVITDMKMPIMSGLDMIKKIRNIDDKCGIIINTEVKEVDFILTSVDIGIDRYIIKPINLDKINDALEAVSKKVYKNKYNYNAEEEVLFSLSKEERRKIEEGIKSKMSAFYKEKVGKGPRYIHVLFKNNEIKVKAFEVLTYYEKSFLNSEHNISLMEYNRYLFYKNNEKYLENILKGILNINVKLCNYHANVAECVDELTFICKL